MKLVKTITITILSMAVIFILIPYILGYKIVYLTEASYDYQALGAFGQWVGAIIPIFLVFLSTYITQRINDAKNEITKSNVATVDYVNEMIEEIKNSITKKGQNFKQDTEEEKNEKLKSRAFKYISISGFVKTQKVAEHLNVTEEEAFDILNELMRVDGKITCGGRANKDNIDNIIWLKKKS